ncbi:MAG: sel1 repeat family protein, partial [Pseudomonadota bacterium]|nr:sel1 repeat family protein [Pseudomonadota bacterium]
MEKILLAACFISLAIVSFPSFAMTNEMARQLESNAVQDLKDTTDLAQLQSAALSGDPIAQYWLGSFYFTTNHLSKAVYWDRKSAYQGYAAAEYQLSVDYILGLGVTKDSAKSEYWSQKASFKKNNPKDAQQENKPVQPIKETDLQITYDHEAQNLAYRAFYGNHQAFVTLKNRSKSNPAYLWGLSEFYALKHEKSNYYSLKHSKPGLDISDPLFDKAMGRYQYGGFYGQFHEMSNGVVSGSG